MEIDKLSVGQQILGFKTGRAHMQMDFTGLTWILAIGFPDINEQELHDINFGDLQVGYTTIDGDLFFLFKLGSLPWADAPYEPRYYAEAKDYFQVDDPECGVSLLILAVDTNTGMIKKVRTVGIGNTQMNKLHQFCREKDKLRPFTDEDVAAYRRRLNSIYQKYPTSESMLKTMPIDNYFAILNPQNP